MKQSLHPIALELNPDTPKIMLYDGRHLLPDGMQDPKRRLGVALGGRIVDVCREAGNIAEYRRRQNALIVPDAKAVHVNQDFCVAIFNLVEGIVGLIIPDALKRCGAIPGDAISL